MRSGLKRSWLAVLVVLLAFRGQPSRLFAQAPSPSASPRQIGTIKSVDANTLVLSTDKGEQVSIAVSPETKVVQLPVGSTDLKAAQPAALSDVTAGDRVLAIGSAGDTATSLNARRLVLMKSTDIAQRHAAEQAGWQHGSGGLVRAVDPAAGVITIATGSRTVTINTTASTIFRRYAPTSARFEDATASTLADLHAGDQLRVRGDRSADGSIKADEIVSGSFRHLSGTILSMNASANQLTVKDLKTRKPVTLSLTPGTEIHRLPPEVAARFATRTRAAGSTTSSATGAGTTPPVAQRGPADQAPGAEGSAQRSGAGDLSQTVSHLPAASLSDFKIGDAIMVVGTDGNAGSIAALTMLGGVEPILAASPNGGAEVALSPWSMGGGGESSGAAAQ